MFKKLYWRKNAAYIAIPLAVLAALCALWAFIGKWPWMENSFNSYTLQACAWLEGRLDLGKDYPWLELAIYEGKYFVSFPPFPSYVLLPLAAVFGTSAPEALVSLAFTLAGAVYAVLLVKKLTGDLRSAELLVLFLYLANGYLFIGATGWVWFLAQSMCFTLSLMALYYAASGRGGLSLGFWACAVGCRPMVIVYFPFLCVLLIKQWNKTHEDQGVISLIKARWYWAAAPLFLGGTYMTLNYLRFDSVIEFGHNYLPEFTRTAEGQFSASYILGNIKNILRAPTWNGGGSPLTFDRVDGCSAWLLNPIFIAGFCVWIFALIKRRKESRETLYLLPLLLMLHLLILLCHKSFGGWHFGNRYLADMFPYVFYGILAVKPPKDILRHALWPLFILGFALNLIGTAALYNGWL